MIKFSASLKHSVTKTNNFFYAGAVVVTNSLGVKINKATERKGQCGGGGGYKIRLNS